MRKKEKRELPFEFFHSAIRRFFLKFDLLQIIPLFLLLTIGLLFIYSVGQQVGGHHLGLFFRQSCYLCVGIALWFFLVFFDYRRLGPLCLLFYPLVLGLLSFLLFFGPVRNNTRRWLDVGSISIQPSEFGKMAVLFSLAWLLSFKRVNVNRVRWFLLSVLLAVIPFYLIYKEPDLGTALVLIPMTAAMMFAAKLRWLFILVITVVIVGLTPVAYMEMKTYQKERILTFLDPDRDPLNRGWNAIQAEIAVGIGGIMGKGYRNGTHCTLGYLPQMVADSDFIFPVIAEETGFAGSCTIIFLYACLLFSILRTALLARDDFGRYLCVGVAAILLTHVFINIGMCIRLVPITGLPLPFISYGGTFLLAMLVYLGIVQSVYSHSCIEGNRDEP